VQLSHGPLGEIPPPLFNAAPPASRKIPGSVPLKGLAEGPSSAGEVQKGVWDLTGFVAMVTPAT
jgi:hypothetical protein